MNNDFENAWTAMVNRHNLETNKWVKKMFDDRHLRAEAYLKENYFVVCEIAKIVSRNANLISMSILGYNCPTLKKECTTCKKNKKVWKYGLTIKAKMVG